MEQEKVEERVEATVNKFESDNRELFSLEVSEWAITGKMSEYLQNAFPEFSVDTEYDRHGENEKDDPRPNETGTVRPDILVHRRGTDDQNWLVIEVKKDANPSEIQSQCGRVRAFIENEEYSYEHGLFLDLNGTDDPNFHWYHR